MYENIVSYLQEKAFDARRYLGADEYNAIIAEATSRLETVEIRAGPSVCWLEKQEFKGRLKPFIDGTGHVPKCLQ